MPIFHAIGSGIFLLVIAFVLPPVLAEFEAALVATLHGATVSALTATAIITTAVASIPPPP